jgi:hypothetical protein
VRVRISIERSRTARCRERTLDLLRTMQLEQLALLELDRTPQLVASAHDRRRLRWPRWRDRRSGRRGTGCSLGDHKWEPIEFRAAHSGLGLGLGCWRGAGAAPSARGSR